MGHGFPERGLKLNPKRELPHWHCNKRWTKVSKTRDALAILEEKFEGKTWNEGRQTYYAILLNKKGLSKSTNPRSTRAIMGTFKFFGFAYTYKKNPQTRIGKLIVTKAGKEFVHGNVSDILKLQLLKWQYPNPFEGKGVVAPYTRSLKLFPFRVLLHLLCDMGPLHEDELALFVWKMKNNSPEELKRVKNEILEYRSLNDVEKQQLRNKDPLYTTNHEYEAHIRPYILETGYCCFDTKTRKLGISPGAKEEIQKIITEEVEPKIDWTDENEWFEYFGDTMYSNPPRNIQLKIESKVGVQTGVYVRVIRNSIERYGVTDEDGIVTFSIYDNLKYRVEVLNPKDGSTLFRDFLAIKPKESFIRLFIKKGLPTRKESLKEILEKVNQLLKKRLDDEIKSRLEMRSRVTGVTLEKRSLRYIRGARFEQLVYKILSSFKTKIFDEVLWNGKIGEWGLPTPAQKVSKETGKKLPDILVFQNNDVYVVETTLLKGRSQLEKPEAVSVPDHVENMISTYKGKNVTGLFIAEKLDPSVVTNLVTRGINHNYKIIPIEINEFLDMVRLMETSGREFWKSNLTYLWKVNRRIVTYSIK